MRRDICPAVQSRPEHRVIMKWTNIDVRKI